MRTKGIGNLENDIEAHAKKIFDDFFGFTHGVRYLALLHRSKDGGHNKEYHRRGGFYVTHTREEYLEALVKLLTLQAVSSTPYRLYASVNPRDLRKAEHKFKVDMLDADYASQENKDYFWQRLESRWAGALMSPGCKDGSLFIIDVDNQEGIADTTAETLMWLSKNGIEMVKQYQTPNGWHIIVPPFNPNDFKVENAEIKKDALMLLHA